MRNAPSRTPPLSRYRSCRADHIAQTSTRQRADAPLVRYYVLSKYMSPKRLLHVTRSHWASRIACIGYSMFNSPRIVIGREKTTHPRILPYCERSHSTSCKRFRFRPRYAAKSNAQDGMMPSFCRQSAICDSPATNGDRSISIHNLRRLFATAGQKNPARHRRTPIDRWAPCHCDAIAASALWAPVWLAAQALLQVAGTRCVAPFRAARRVQSFVLARHLASVA